MPRKYKPTADEYFFFFFSEPVYGMLRPIEEQLKKGGYRGLTLTDFNHNLCNMLEIEENPDMNFRDKMQNASVVDEGEIIVDGRVIAGKTLTKNGRRDFRDYINKYSNLLELLIKNTPPEEYPEEVAEMKYHQTYIRMLKVFGSRQLFSDKLAFLPNARNYDGDFDGIKERGNAAAKGVSREFWRHVRAYYPYSDLNVDCITLSGHRQSRKLRDPHVLRLLPPPARVGEQHCRHDEDSGNLPFSSLPPDHWYT